MTIPFNANEKVCNQRSGVYAIVNIVTRKFYIGSAVKLNKRKRDHLNLLRKSKHKNRHLQSSYNKYGEDCFIFKVLEYVEDKNLLEDIEDIWIKQYKPLGVTYNIREEASSNLGMKHSEETKKKMSLTRKNISDETRKKLSEVRKGIIFSDETKRKLSEANKGKIISDEAKKKMSKAKKGIILSDETRKRMSEARKGRSFSDETRKKMSEVRKGIIFSDETRKKMSLIQQKPVLQFTKDNEFVKRYNSILEASKEVKNTHISACCLGKRKSAGGFIWKYE